MEDNLRAWSKSKSYHELIESADDYTFYVETQIYGQLDLSDVDRILVPTKSEVGAVRKRLDAMGFTDIEVKARW